MNKPSMNTAAPRGRLPARCSRWPQ